MVMVKISDFLVFRYSLSVFSALSAFPILSTVGMTKMNFKVDTTNTNVMDCTKYLFNSNNALPPEIIFFFDELSA